MIIFGKNDELLNDWMQHFDCFEIDIDDKLYAVNMDERKIDNHFIELDCSLFDTWKKYTNFMNVKNAQLVSYAKYCYCTSYYAKLFSINEDNKEHQYMLTYIKSGMDSGKCDIDSFYNRLQLFDLDLMEEIWAGDYMGLLNNITLNRCLRNQLLDFVEAQRVLQELKS